jgi:hypothetical protein
MSQRLSKTYSESVFTLSTSIGSREQLLSENGPLSVRAVCSHKYNPECCLGRETQ